VLDDRLKLRTFLVGCALTLIDIILCCHLNKLFNTILTPDSRKPLVNLTRWFTFIRNLKPFIDCFGLMTLCHDEPTIEFGDNEEKEDKEVKNKHK
jgi:hypothetical protein